MSNLATIVNNILADSGIDDINVVVTTGSYSNPAWITSLAWTKITGAPSNIVTGTGTSGQISFWNGTTTQAGDNGLLWNNSSKLLRVVNGGIEINNGSSTGLLYKRGDAFDFSIENSTGNLEFFNYGADDRIMRLVKSTNRVSIGNDPSPTSKLFVRGVGSTSATFSFNIVNSSLTNLLSVRDDGQVSTSGDILMNSNLVATQSWVNSQGFVTGGPFAALNGNTSNSFGVFELTYAATTFNPAAAPRTTLNPMSVKMWNNYFNGTGLGSDYGTVMEYYSLGAHVDSQVYFDAGGGSWYRSASYAAGWQAWKEYITSANIGSQSVSFATTAGSITGQANSATITAATAATANTIVLRDGNGDIYSRYSFSSYVNTSDNDEAGITRFVIKNGDNYHRSATTTVAADIIRGVASGSWGISITGNAATATILQTARTLTIGGTGKAFNGSANVAWSLSEIGVPSKSGEGAIGTWGINITGNANSVTNGVYTTGDQTIGGLKTFSSTVTANRYSGINSLILNNYTTLNPSSNVFLYSQPNDRDAWIFLDSADTASNWGLYHRQIDSAVGGLPGNSIGFIGGGASTLQAYISLANGDAYFRGTTTIGGNISAANLSGTNTGDQTNISGSATSLNSSNFIERNGETNYNTSFEATPAGTARYIGDVGGGANNPGNTWWVVQNFRHSNSSNFWGTQVAWGWEDNQNRLATRNVSGGSYGAWVYYLNSANFNSYAPTLTGGGASGTWGISITGAADSVNGLTLTSSANNLNPDNVTQNQIGYNTSVALFGQTDGGLYSSAYSSAWIHQIFGDFRTGQIAIRGKNNNTWQAWRTVLDSSNYNSYAPTLTGGGATGTWAINISGNASSATNAGNSNTVANLSPPLFFNNMGQPHTAYNDANNVGDFGVRYINGTANSPNTGSSQYYGFTLGLGADYAFSSYASQFYWGRFGNPYVSVRFNEGGAWGAWSKIWAGYADSAGSVAWTNVSGRPTALSAFTNDTGFISNSSDAFPSIPRTNFIVTLTAAEYAALSPKQTDTLYVVV
jgi:hypothetical protein